MREGLGVDLLAEFVRSRVAKHTLQALIYGFWAGVSLAIGVLWSIFGQAAVE